MKLQTSFDDIVCHDQLRDHLNSRVPTFVAMQSAHLAAHNAHH